MAQENTEATQEQATYNFLYLCLVFLSGFFRHHRRTHVTMVTVLGSDLMRSVQYLKSTINQRFRTSQV